jgi:hypothetical protein
VTPSLGSLVVVAIRWRNSDKQIFIYTYAGCGGIRTNYTRARSDLQSINFADDTPLRSFQPLSNPERNSKNIMSSSKDSWEEHFKSDETALIYDRQTGGVG